MGPIAASEKVMAANPYGRYCCVSWCPNSGHVHNRQVPSPKTHFFRIPRDDRATAWVAYAERDDLKGKPVSILYTSYRVCSDHFTAQDYVDPGHLRLSRTAVPTVRPGSLQGTPSLCPVNERASSLVNSSAGCPIVNGVAVQTDLTIRDIEALEEEYAALKRCLQTACSEI